MKKDWYIWCLYFLIFSMIGWIYEVLVFDLELGYGFVNRGFLFGPWIPVYGCGGILILLLFGGLKERELRLGKVNMMPVICFLLIVLVSTATELITSYLMEWTIGEWLWDYSKDIPNFQGRIALKSSLRFGVIGMGGLYFVQPVCDRLFGKLRAIAPLGFCSVSYIMIGLFMVDAASRFVLGSNYVGP